ncbi:hypothetical protein G7068_11630 [Leucobacter viscericola]|uniref:Uncharacterized protein n=1 Tax=Leucobacter viscericola TaxID=2714935 RepID=A0A6G7XGU0_9MICO|nr:hypothetical protein [Leucobacter viscericola]QIK63763.1 hypothetical protein G7068_11630 [Leucobacter viscericola]
MDTEHQITPLISLYWSKLPGAICQNITTVTDPNGTQQVSFMAADGEWQGRYLGDDSNGGIVDWAQQSFAGVTIPDPPAPAPLEVTPATPTLKPANACGVEPTVTVPETDGVEYAQQRSSNTITITAQAAEDHVIAQGSETEWSFDVTAEACEEETAPPGPTERPTDPTAQPTERPTEPESASPSPAVNPASTASASPAQLTTTGSAGVESWIGLAAALLVAAAAAGVLGRRARS